MFNNSAFIGLLGVVIGSLISFLCTVYVEKKRLESLREEQNYIRESSAQDNKENIYGQFLDLINLYQNMILARLINQDNFLSNDDAKVFLKDMSSVLSKIDLFASKEIRDACHNLYAEAWRIFDSTAFKTQYEFVIELLQKDLNK